MKILIIDDTISILDALRSALQPTGHECITCHTSRSGLEAFRNGNFDLVITDFVMPDIGGAEMIQSMRNMKRNVSIVLISGYINLHDIRDVLRLGADAFLHKPFNFKDLMEVVQQVERKVQDSIAQEQQQ